MSIPMNMLFAAHVEWCGLRKELSPAERRSLVRWIARTKPQIVAEARGDLTELGIQCRDLQRRRSTSSADGIGDAFLKKHAEAIVAKYLKAPAGVSFESFLTGIVSQCRTEASLRLFLHTRP